MNTEVRYQQLFDSAPVSLWEEDFSEVKRELDELRRAGVTDLAAYLDERPEDLRSLVRQIRVLDVNETTLHLYGADSKESFLSRVPALFAEDSYMNFREDLLTIWEGRTHFSAQGIHHTLQGMELQVHVKWAVVAGFEHTYERVLVTVVGISGFLSAGFVPAQQLRETEAQYRQLFETMSQGVIYQDASGRIISVNSAAEEILGLSMDQILGKSSMDPQWRMIREDGTEVRGSEHPAMVSLLSGKPVGPVVRGVYRPDLERHIWLKIVAIPLFHSGEPKPYQVYATFENITEAKEAGEERQKAGMRAATQRRAISELVVNATTVDGDLLENLRQITEVMATTLGIARASVWQLSTDGESLHCLDLFAASTSEHTQAASPKQIQVTEHPAYFAAIRERSQVYAQDTLRDPRTAELVEDYLKPLNISSLLDSGVVVEGELIGLVSCEHIGPVRTWTPDEEAFVSTVAALVAQLFEHKEKQKAQEALQQQLEEKEILLRETHHRIKNNLSSIGSLLTLQAHEADLAETIDALEAAAGRISSMARLYERMLISEVTGDIRVDQYLRDMVESVVELYNSTGNCDVQLNVEPFQLSSRQLFPLGIIVNELLTNTMKYAFSGGCGGTVEVAASLHNGQVQLSVSDDGVGLPVNFDPEKDGGFGLSLVRMLASQLHAELSIESSGGTTVALTFPA